MKSANEGEPWPVQFYWRRWWWQWLDRGGWWWWWRRQRQWRRRRWWWTNLWRSAMCRKRMRGRPVLFFYEGMSCRLNRIFKFPFTEIDFWWNQMMVEIETLKKGKKILTIISTKCKLYYFLEFHQFRVYWMEQWIRFSLLAKYIAIFLLFTKSGEIYCYIFYVNTAYIFLI